MSRRVVHAVATVLLLSQSVAPILAADSSQVNFKIFSPPGATQPADEAAAATPKADAAAGSADSMWSEGDPGSKVPPGSTVEATTPAASTSEATPAATDSALTTQSGTTAETPKTDTSVSDTPAAATETPKADATSTDAAGVGTAADGKDGKVLQGYIRVVPSGTKLPIIMDSAVDSDTSQEGDEFAARTSEDLTIDGSTVVPAGSVIKGRIARINAPKHMDRSGSVGLKFDTITTPDNKQIALQATLVARGGVVHARRGMKDIALETGMVAAPIILGTAIGAIAGNANANKDSGSSTKIGMAGGLLIGAGIGAAIGVVIICAKKGKRVDMRPGDELKIELAEDLRMPMAPM